MWSINHETLPNQVGSLMKKRTFYLLTPSKQRQNKILSQLGGRLVKKSIYDLDRMSQQTESCCDLLLKVSKGENCSSSPVCHRVVTKSYCNLVFKASKKENFSSLSVCHIVVTDSVTKRWVSRLDVTDAV